MSYFNKIVLMIAVILFSSSLCVAVENPFSATVDVDKRATSEGMMLLIKAGIASRSGEDSNYLLKLNIPETNIKILDGKKVFTGVLGPLKSDEFYITIKGVSEGEGEIIAKVYVSLDGNSVDASTVREFVAKYKVSKDLDVSITKVEERQTGVKPETQVQAQAQTAPITMDQMKDVAQVVDDTGDTSQKFVINSGNRYNNVLRGILFIACFIIVGYLLYLSMKKK